MAALLAAARDPAYPGRDRAGAVQPRRCRRAWRWPRDAGVPTRCDRSPRRSAATAPAHEAAIEAALRGARHRDRLPRRLHAAADAAAWSARWRGPDAQHPSQPAAGLSRARHACARAGRRREAAWLHRASGDARRWTRGRSWRRRRCRCCRATPRRPGRAGAGAGACDLSAGAAPGWPRRGGCGGAGAAALLQPGAGGGCREPPCRARWRS